MKQTKNWYRLDNAAKIYPAVRTRSWSGNFRLSINLTEEIDPIILQQALNDLRKRIVNLNLELKKGVFWYFLEETDRPVFVEPDKQSPCMRIGGRHNHDMPYRVTYYNKRIAIELFHALADGTGGIIFLKSLAARYIHLKYHEDISEFDGIISCDSQVLAEEMEDAFKRYAKFRTVKSRSELKGYHFKGTQLPYEQTSVITGIIPFDVLYKKAKTYQVTVTELIVALMIESFMKCQSESKTHIEKPVKVSVPINLRKLYPSKTLRNFALFINPGIEPRYGEFTLEEIIEEVHHFMRMNNKEKYLNAMMCKNLSDEYNPLLRIIPLGLKNMAMYIAFKKYGETLVSSTFSNLGRVDLPPEMAKYTERVEFMLGRFMSGMPSAAAASWNGNLYINWTSGFREKNVERGFFTSLVKMGIPVKIESNLI